MKNVLILTDFSAGAMRAAESALLIAAKLGADVLLVNAYPITPYLPPVGSAIIPQRSADDKRRESTGRLDNEARRPINRLRSLGLPGDAPTIRPIALEGRLADGVSGLARRKKAY
ncbi:universal stress protein [Mucilaginibacter sp.]|uniref:universal stress protein n=1 Tax=Mucilaginibacter sp. TaxID=1882438 RepID=UPI0025D78842|nr:universal stress protein [Mucilaginibacter sp.]